MNNDKIWRFNLTYSVACLLTIALTIDYFGAFMTTMFRVELWLSSIGTILAGVSAGPFGGLIVGILSPLIYGLIDASAFEYCAINAMIGLCTGIIARTKGWGGISDAVFLAAIVIAISSVISTPINVFTRDGRSGMPWTESLYFGLLRKGHNIWFVSFITGLITDIADKSISVAIVYLAWKRINFLRSAAKWQRG